MMNAIQVCVLQTNRDFFYYTIDGPIPPKGARVWVPFRNKTRLGVVIDQCAPCETALVLKPITSVIDLRPVLSDDVLTLCAWISRYYQTALPQVLAMALPKKYREGEIPSLPKTTTYHVKGDEQNANKTTDQSTDRLISHEIVTESVVTQKQLNPNARRKHALFNWIACQPQGVTLTEISEAGFSRALFKSLLETNLLDRREVLDTSRTYLKDRTEPLALNAEQAVAVNTIVAQLGAYQCFLLHGVTGSGKTEVYLQIIAQVLAGGQQVLILVPEIGLTPQLLARFSARFHSHALVVMHSHLNDRERQIAWQKACEHRVDLVIGTRSAIFTPMPALGLIVIDEEHDTSLKQMDGVRYSARDTALMRAHAANIPIILGTATPSLETLHNAQTQKYTLLRLNQKALNTTPLHYQLIDIRNQSLQHGLSETTIKTIDAHLQQQNQVLVFINRRGYAPVLLCHTCGWMADCLGCDSHLTLHRTHNRLICHHCGSSAPMIARCRSCQSEDLVPIGIGTQRVADYLKERFPTTPLLRLDRDAISRKNALAHALASIAHGEVSLIIGTQLLAKGHHFPRLTLVVVLDADNGFYNTDFRALEHLGQLLTQVAGRAGRAEAPGQVLIQTHLPHHPLLNQLVKFGYDAFADSLLKTRQEAELPPYTFVALIRAESRSLSTLLQCMHAMKTHLSPDIQVLGPAPAPLGRKAHFHRMQLLVKSTSRKALGYALCDLREWLLTQDLDRGVRWHIDVDPIELS